MQENVEALPRLLSGECAAGFAQSVERIADIPSPDFSLNALYRHSDAERPPLRIGVLVNGKMAELFMRKIIEDVIGSNFAQLVAVIENAAPLAPPAPRRSLAAKVVRTLTDSDRRGGLGYQAYLRKIDRRYAIQPDPCANVDCSDLFAGVERILVRPLQKGFVDRFPPEAIDKIKALDLDVILRFGFRIIRGEILTVARYGVWSYHHGDSERYRGGPALMWEIMEDNPISGAVLQRLEESLDAGPVFARGIFATALRPSVSMNRFGVYWSTQHFVIQKLNELHRYGWEHLQRKVFRPGAYRGKRAIYRRPKNLEVARWLVPRLAKTAARKIVKYRPEVTHWRIGLRRTATPLYAQTAPSMAGFQWLESPRGKFWADPFLIRDAGHDWLIFEDFSYAQDRGAISCGRLDHGKLVDVRTVMERPYHLSYPHVLRHEGEIWMIPESAQAGQVLLYRARKFPDDWVCERALLDIPAADCTPFEHEGRWYMFVSPNIVARVNVATTLLFEAPTLQGPWKLHPAGAICNDVRWARCAGAIIRQHGKLVRPSQDGSNGYGYSVSFNEVRLSATTYEEKPIAVLNPDPRKYGVWGTHTYNRLEEWEVIDGRAPAVRSSVT